MPDATVANSTERANDSRRYFPLPLARAAIAAVFALVVTFSADHSPRLGLISFGAFAVASGAAAVVLALSRMESTAPTRYLIAQGAASIVFGGASLVANSGGVGTLSAVVVGWGAVCGAIELACGIRLRRHPASGDWIVVGALTVLLAVAVASVPLGFSDDFIGEQRVAGTLTASIVIVGVLGAYAAIVAVFSVIAGISARSRPEPGAGPPVEAGRMPS